MNKLFCSSRTIRSRLSRSFSTSSDVDYSYISSSVNEYCNRVTSLWSMRNINIKSSSYFRDDIILKLATKHLGRTEVDDLLKLSPENKSGKLPNAMSSTKIVYEECINRDINFTDNDIWLGYSKYISFLNVSLKHRAKNLKYLIQELENIEKGSQTLENSMESGVSTNSEINFDECRRIFSESEDFDNYTIFIFPYLRRTSKEIVDVLTKGRGLLSQSDFKSIIYASGSTGSSRLLRFMGSIINENFSEINPKNSFHKVDSHAWPWMNKVKEDGNFLNTGLTVLLDALSSCSIIRYSLEGERQVYDYLMNNLKSLETLIQQFGDSGSGNKSYSDKELSSLEKYDNDLLEKVISLMVIKRNFSQLGNDQIRTFSDFVCDRLHRIQPKLLSNIAFSLGHCKSLDEFWMFMISKQIQMIYNKQIESKGDFYGDKLPTKNYNLDNMSLELSEAEGTNSEFEVEHNDNYKLSGRDESSEFTKNDKFDMDDVTAIFDAYSTAGLEDYNFYSTICKGIKDEFPSYTLHHKAVIIRSMAKVRHRDVDLLNDFMKSLNSYIETINEDSYGIQNQFGGSYPGSNSISKNKRNVYNIKSYLIKPIDSYIVASGIVSTCDLDFRVDNIDPLWRVLALKVKDSSFDICAISWLPIATIMFPSIVSLTEFLPIWLKHVNYTITKLRSRTYMMMIQRRQLLLKHAFNLEILPSRLLSDKSKKIMKEICDKNYITCKEDHTPESSTFHLEVCACLRALGVTHQREINVIPFVMDIVILPDKIVDIKSSFTSEAERATDRARCGNIIKEGESDIFPLKYTRNLPNHRKHKEEVYTIVPNS